MAKVNYDLTEGTVVKHIFRYLIPAICGTMVTSIYILADTIIIGKGIGIDAMAALNIALPLYNIFFGIGLLYGVGGSVLMSFARGRNEERTGNKYFSTALVLTLITALIVTALLLAFLKPVIAFLGATDITTPYVMSYAPVVISGCTIFACSSFFQTFVRNDGAPKLAMVAVITGGVLNIILDLVFVCVLKFGMTGAAIATVTGAFTTLSIVLTHFLSKSNRLHIRVKDICFNKATEILRAGSTSFLLEVSAGVVMFVFNIQILKYIGDIGVSVYGIITNTVIVINCLCNGVNQAVQPLLSVNFGAGLADRVRKIRNIGVVISTVLCVIVAVAGLIKPDIFTYMFMNPTKEILELSSVAVRVYFAGFFIMGINMFMTGFFQSTLKSEWSMIICLSRGVVCSLLLVYLLPWFIGDLGIWMAMPLAELITFFVIVCMVAGKKKGCN